MMGAAVGPDPIFHHLRVELRFSLGPTSGRAGATMAFGNQVSCEQILASRPVMNGSDELVLSVVMGVSRCR